MHICRISAHHLTLRSILSPQYLQVAIMYVECRVLGWSYRLVDVQGEINSVAERAAHEYPEQQLGNCACSSCYHWKRRYSISECVTTFSSNRTAGMKQGYWLWLHRIWLFHYFPLTLRAVVEGRWHRMAPWYFFACQGTALTGCGIPYAKYNTWSMPL